MLICNIQMGKCGLICVVCVFISFFHFAEYFHNALIYTDFLKKIQDCSMFHGTANIGVFSFFSGDLILKTITDEKNRSNFNGSTKNKGKKREKREKKEKNNIIMCSHCV